ncbi:hypothetical protein Y695_04104 [Hydrogenophaga sp. T4]|nr:hypothetical protein Y695_04104 [Hydrogenophaga sp. T4]
MVQHEKTDGVVKGLAGVFANLGDVATQGLDLVVGSGLQLFQQHG